MGWVKLGVATTVLVAAPIYAIRQHQADQAAQNSAEQITHGTGEGVILAIDPLPHTEGQEAMVDITVAFQTEEKHVRMKAAEAADFTENETVDVHFSLRNAPDGSGQQIRIDSISEPVNGDPA